MRRWARVTRNVVLGLLATPIVLVLAGHALLLTDGTRAYVRDWAVELASRALHGKLRIEHLDSLSVFGLTARGVTLHDAQGTLVVSVKSVRARIDLLALLDGTLHLTYVALDDGYVDLGAPEAGGGGLPGMLASGPEEPDDADRGLRVRIDQITLLRVAARAELDGAEWRVHELSSRATLDVAEQLTLSVSRLQARIERAEAPLATIIRANLRYDPASKSHAEIVLRSEQIDALARVRARAVGPLQRLQVNARVETPGATATATGEVGTDGSFDLSARVNAAALSEVHVLRTLAPEARGKLDLTLHAAREANGALAGRMSLGLRHASYGGVAVRSLSLRAQARGRDLSKPVLAAELRASGVEAFNSELDAVQVAVSGDASGYVASGELDAGRLRARLRPEGESWLASGSLTVPLQDQVLTARLGALRFGGEPKLAISALALSYGSARARIDGRLSAGDRLALRVRARASQLGALTRLFMAEPLEGAADLALDARGPLRAPRVKLALGYRVQELFGVRRVALRLDASANLLARQAVAEARLRAQGIDVRLSARSRLPRGALTLVSLKRSHAELDLRIARLALHELSQWPELRFAPQEALVSGAVRGRGKLGAIELVADIKARARFAKDEAPLTAELRGSFGRDDELAVALDVADGQGPLVRLQTRLDLGRRPAFDLDGARRLLLQRAWRASAWLGARRVDELPLTRALDVPQGLWPARVSAHAQLAHQPGKEPAGELNALMLWDPPGRSSPSPRCGAGLRPRIELTAEMHDGQLRTELRAGSGDRQTLEASSVSHAPVDEWLRVSVAQARPVQVYATVDELRLHQVPVVCEQVSGTVSGQATLERGLTQAVTVELDLRGHRLRFADSPPIEARVSARAKQDAILASATLRAEGGLAEISARLPLDRGGRFPSLRWSAPAKAGLQIRQLPMSALVGFLPGVSSSGGTIAGNLGMRGPLADPVIEGKLALRDVNLTLGELGQRFARINGELAVHGRNLVLSRTTFRDRGGRATISGRLTWRSFTPASLAAAFDLHAKDLPIRHSGVMAARLDGKLGVTADVSPERIDIEATLRKGRIELMSADLGAVQSLDPNPEITFTDAPQQEEVPETEDATAVRIRINAKDPFWVQRQDFSALVTAQLTITARPEPVRITGEIDVQRGVVELLGQMFDLERARIRFSGGREINPELDLVASRRSPGGGKVTIYAQGSVREPELRFQVDGKDVTAGEALAAALGTRATAGGEERVQDQVGSLATGIAGSVLTLGARRELGDWVPVLGFEQGGGEKRVRAGIEADRLIPSFLRGVVVDAYLEGIISSRGQTDGGQGTNETSTGAAVLLELRHPYSLVSEAQYGPGPRWSLDLSWEP